MNKHVAPLSQAAFVSLIVIMVSGCSLGTMLMAGYQPPQTIADLMREEYGLANELPPELRNNDGQGNKQIRLESYPQGEGGSVTHIDQYGVNLAPSLFRPRYTHKGLEDYAAQLMMTMHKNSVGLRSDLRIGVSSFVVLDESLQNTTVLGNRMAEFMITEMQKYGLSVIDHKLKPALMVTSTGDIAFSRDVRELSSTDMMDHVLAGTMIEKADGTFVNARIISTKDNRVIASAHLTIPDFIVAKSTQPFIARGY